MSRSTKTGDGVEKVTTKQHSVLLKHSDIAEFIGIYDDIETTQQTLVSTPVCLLAQEHEHEQATTLVQSKQARIMGPIRIPAPSRVPFFLLAIDQDVSPSSTTQSKTGFAALCRDNRHGAGCISITLGTKSADDQPQPD